VGALTTARPWAWREHQKARYRVLVFGVLALFGPPAFGITAGPLSALYSLLIFAYSLWSLRLTVVIQDDRSLGPLLSVLDVALTLPLLVWGSAYWLALPLVGFWAVSLASSVIIHRICGTPIRTSGDRIADAATGLYQAHRFPRGVESEASHAASRGGCFGLVTVHVHRYEELLSYYGPDAAQSTMVSVVRRTRRAVGKCGEGFRLGPDRIAFLTPVGSPAEAAELAVQVSRAAGERLVEGRRIDTTVGYAVGPRDGATAAELVASAKISSFEALGSLVVRSEESRAAGAAARVRVAIG